LLIQVHGLQGAHGQPSCTLWVRKNCSCF
jgi:hypothetical protein